MRAYAASALALALLASCAASGAGSDPHTLQLVETWPVETDLDHRGIPDTHEVWVEMIEGAETSIDFGQFYASSQPGSRLEPVLAALEAAIERGVRVRFLSSSTFVDTYPETLARLADMGAEVRDIDYREIGGGVQHAKYFVVDGRDAFLGSQNFDWRALEHIQELGIRVRDREFAARLERVFALDWAAAAGEAPPTTPLGGSGFGVAHGEQFHLVASPAGQLPDESMWDLPQLVNWIDSAEERVWVQLLSYKAKDYSGKEWRELEAALLRATERGVDVRLLLSDWQKRASTIGGLQKLQRFDGIEVRLVTIPQWSGGFIPFARTIHAKFMLVDDVRSWIGTSNWDRGYFYESRNVGILVEGERTAGQLEDFFETTWDSDYAETVDPTAMYTAPRVAE